MSIGLAKFDPKLAILAALAHGESCGVALMGEYDIGPGTVYPALRDLERAGFAAPRPGETEPGKRGRPKIFYRLTPAGQEEVDALRERFRVWLGEAA